MSHLHAEVVVTGTTWMGQGIGSVDSALRRLFQEAQHNMLVSAYSVSSGANTLFDWIGETLGRGVEIRLVVNRLYQQPAEVVERLSLLNHTFPHFRLYDFVDDQGHMDLHAKLVITDRRLALIGSANLSRRGLLDNHEMGVLLEGPPASQASAAFDLVLASDRVVEVEDTSDLNQ